MNSFPLEISEDEVERAFDRYYDIASSRPVIVRRRTGDPTVLLPSAEYDRLVAGPSS